MNKINKFRMLDLFCGAGGFSYGMHQNSHFETKIALDFNEPATNTFKKNMPEVDVIAGDITNEDVRKLIIKRSKEKKVNMIVGGPPCQGFAMKGKKLGLADERNFLFLEYLKIVEELKPEVFVIENVKRILSSSGGYFRDEILKYIEKLGYNVSYGVLNAKDFGVPQSRERVILVGVRKDINKSFVFETPPYSLDKSAYQMELWGEKKKALTFKDATEDLQSLENGEKSYTDPLHWAITHPEHVIEWLIDVPEGHSAHENENPELRPPSGFNTTYKRNVWNEPCSTISTNFSMISGCRNVHPTDTRSLTIREAARVQSFPDEFVFCGNWGEIRKSIGNAVPPILARAIAKEIIGQIFKEK